MKIFTILFPHRTCLPVSSRHPITLSRP